MYLSACLLLLLKLFLILIFFFILMSFWTLNTLPGWSQSIFMQWTLIIKWKIDENDFDWFILGDRPFFCHWHYEAKKRDLSESVNTKVYWTSYLVNRPILRITAWGQTQSHITQLCWIRGTSCLCWRHSTSPHRVIHSTVSFPTIYKQQNSVLRRRHESWPRKIAFASLIKVSSSLQHDDVV